MGGVFRDEELATRARAEALDRRVRELEDEKHALEARLLGGQPLAQRSRGPSLATIALGLGGVALLGGLLFVRALPLALLLAVVLVFMTLVWGVVFRQYVQARPGELWVVSGGRGVTDARGGAVGYRLLFPGQRRLLLPFIEVATSLSLRPTRLEVEVDHLPVLGGRAARVRLVASVMVDRDNPHRAIERFLGCPSEELREVATDITRSVVRTVLAEVPVAEAEPLRRALEVALGAELARVGLALDALHEIIPAPALR